MIDVKKALYKVINFSLMLQNIFNTKNIIRTTLVLILFAYTSNIAAQCADPSPTGDCDGDLILNASDLDDDNDGILDVDEFDCTTGGSLVWGDPTWSGGGPAVDSPPHRPLR